jgi:hypothetical protein
VVSLLLYSNMMIPYYGIYSMYYVRYL